MKTLKYILLVLTLASASCSKDFLNRSDPNALSESTFFKTARDADQALTAVYARLQSGTFSLNIPYLESLADCGVPPPLNSGYNQLSLGTESPGDGGAADARWSESYAGIFRANYFLNNIDKVSELDADKRTIMKAEARFLRAFYYSNLLYFFGDVPLLLDVASIEAAINATRAPKTEVLKAILDDLTFAIENLPLTAVQKGRATKAAAAALKTRIHLYEKDYENTIATASKILSGEYGSFGLYNNYVTLFREAGQKNNNEIIFSVQFSSVEQINEGFNWDNTFRSDAAAVGVINSFVDSYESTNGLAINDPANTLYDPANPYNNRDPRLKYTIHTPGDQWGTRGTWPKYRTGNSNTYPFSNSQIYAFRKYINPETESPRVDGGSAPNGTDFILLRYADVLLMYAEAKIESGAIDLTVLDAINRVRARAYGTTVDNVAGYPEIITINQEALREILRRERKVEFAYEGLRWLDLVRWNILQERRLAIGRAWQSNVWPIPSSEIVKAPGLTQNDAWK